MKTKTRNLIGKILVWGGLVGVGISTYLMYLQYDIISVYINTHTSGLSNGNSAFAGWINVISIIALLIGGLWGMKR